MLIALSTKRGAFRAWLALFPAFFLLWYFPYIDLKVRLATLVVGIFIILGSICFSWKLQPLRWSLLGIYGLVTLFLVLPGHASQNRSTLPYAYCEALESYTGCHYVWGGEGYFGIDCSGFVRKGLEDALFTKGFSNFDPALVRESISLYWHDTSAKVIGEGYLGRTFLVTECPMLNTLDYSLIRQGDLAVTSNGVHVMAYLGNKTWIAADPGEGKVTKFVIPEKVNGYFFTPMRIVRWKILSE